MAVSFKGHALNAIRRFSKLCQADLDFFKSTTHCLQENLEDYNLDYLKIYNGKSKLVLKPSKVEEISKILSYCNQRDLALVPQGGNTGLVGGSVPVNDEIILSLSNLNKIKSFDSVSGILTVESGCILQVLDEWLQERGFIMPLDLGAKGSCHIGGNVSTNAGGVRFLRYGSLHGTVLSMEVVLPDGRVVEMGKPLRKDNTGYDLKHLFIGSEGTLGVITSVSILCPPKPNSVNVAILALESYEKVLQAFALAKNSLGEILSAFEFFDRPALDVTLKHTPSVRDPFDTQSPFYVLIETQGSNKSHDDAKLDSFLEKLLDDEVVSDGVLAQDQGQQDLFWEIREGISDACKLDGGLYKYDLSVPVKDLYSIVLDMRAKMRELGLYHPDTVVPGGIKQILGFGHIGDGNLHLNIITLERSEKIQKSIEPFIYELTAKNEGSISAEHGLGLMKAPYIQYTKSKEMIEIMKVVKKMFDPKGIMNPYKYIS